MARVQGVEVRNGLQGNDGAIGRRRPDPSAFLYPEDVEEAGRGVEIQDRPVWKNEFCRECVSFSLFTKRIKVLQKWDCQLAELLPIGFTGGFVSVWEKNKQ